MLDKNYLSFNEALKVLEKEVPFKSLPSEEVSLYEAYGRITSEDIFAPQDLPGFNRSTVDGYAVRAKDTFGATEGLPAYLNYVGEIKIGEVPERALKEMECMYVPTGGMLPEGADAVVMIENTSLSGNLVEIFKPVSPGENVIFKDEDIKKGELLIPEGTELNPNHVGALASLGITRVKVFKKPRVGIILTGDEIVPAEENPPLGKVRDINSYTLTGLILESGGIPVNFGIVKDDYQTIKEVTEKAFKECDLVLITGGTSVGTKDITEKVISEMGSPGILFHGVKIKPGKPLIGAVVENKPVFGLPGHPVAVVICFKYFVKPVIERLLGKKENPVKCLIKAKISRSVHSQGGRRDFVRVKLERKEDGLWANPLISKSGLITSLSMADGILVIPEDCLGVKEGEEVEIEPL